MRRKMIPLILGVALLFLLVPARAVEGAPFDPILSWTGSAAASITASWRDSARKTETLQVTPKTQYDKSGFTDAAEFSADCKDVSLDGSGVWHYEATAAGLAANTAYLYRVGCGGSWSKASIFTTSDAASKTVTFAYMGDVQTVKDSKAEYALWGKLAQSMYAANPNLSFAVMGGDIVESGISTELFDEFLKNASPVFSKIPLMATNGNHECNFPDTGKPKLYMDEFALPQNGPEGFKEEFYSFNVANCHILVLNSWIFSGEQKLTSDDYERVNDWIKNDLATSAVDWQIVVTHVPVYAVASDKTAAAVRKNWAPIFEKYGVDLVFEGHQHVYSRSYPLTEGRVDYENGVTYIMGNSGQKFYSSADETLAEKTIYGTATYQLTQIDGNALTVRTLDLGGNELDCVSLRQRGISATREDYIETLWRAAGAPAPKTASPFRDAKSPAAAWAYENGIVGGYGKNVFGPEDRITDRQIGLILERMGGAA